MVASASSTFVSELNVTGALSGSSTLAISGLASFDSGFQSSASSSVAGDFTVGNGGIGYFRDGFISSASSTVNGYLNVQELHASSTIAIGGITNFYSNLFLPNLSTSLGIGTSSLGANAVGFVASSTAITKEGDHGGDAAVINKDWTQGNQQRITLTQNVTINFDNGMDGGAYRLILCQDGTGSRTVTWEETTINWRTQAAPTLTTRAGSCDILSFLHSNATGTKKFFGNSSLDY